MEITNAITPVTRLKETFFFGGFEAELFRSGVFCFKSHSSGIFSSKFLFSLYLNHVAGTCLSWAFRVSRMPR